MFVEKTQFFNSRVLMRTVKIKNNRNIPRGGMQMGDKQRWGSWGWSSGFPCIIYATVPEGTTDGNDRVH